MVPFLSPPPQMAGDKTETWSSSEMSKNPQLNPSRPSQPERGKGFEGSYSSYARERRFPTHPTTKKRGLSGSNGADQMNLGARGKQVGQGVCFQSRLFPFLHMCTQVDT